MDIDLKAEIALNFDSNLNLFEFTNLGCYKPTPLRMNLVLEIRTRREIEMETLP